MRIPSEALALRWRDVDWSDESGRFLIHASKTEHHADGGIRVVPLFPEVRVHLQRVFDEAPEGSEYVITRYRDPSANLRTQLVRYIQAAGLKPWPKPWQNMRSSRATELADEYPSHVCAAWLGHIETVANEFYRQVTDEHFARALGGGEKAAQNPAQQLRADDGNKAPAGAEVAEIPAEIEDSCALLPTMAISGDSKKLGAAGSERRAKSPEKRGNSTSSRAESGARSLGRPSSSDVSVSGGAPVGNVSHQDVPGCLQRLQAAWPGLAPPLRAAIGSIIDGFLGSVQPAVAGNHEAEPSPEIQ